MYTLVLENLSGGQEWKNGLYLPSWLPWWLRGSRICPQCGRPGFDPWVGKMPWEKEIAIHASVSDWRIPGTEEAGGLQPMGSPRLGHNRGSNTFPVRSFLDEPRPCHPQDLYLKKQLQVLQTQGTASCLELKIWRCCFHPSTRVEYWKNHMD